nr:hypothetical protein [Isoptericola croceus]
MHGQVAEEVTAVGRPTLQDRPQGHRQHAAEREQVHPPRRRPLPEIAEHDQQDTRQPEEQPEALARRGALAPPRVRQHRHDQRLQRGDERRRPGIHPQPDTPDDPAQVAGLGQQADDDGVARAPVRHATAASAQHGEDRDGQRAGEQVPPGEQGQRRGVLRAQLGSDEAGAPEHDQTDGRQGVSSHGSDVTIPVCILAVPS